MHIELKMLNNELGARANEVKRLEDRIESIERQRSLPNYDKQKDSVFTNKYTIDGTKPRDDSKNC